MNTPNLVNKIRATLNEYHLTTRGTNDQEHEQALFMQLNGVHHGSDYDVISRLQLKDRREYTTTYTGKGDEGGSVTGYEIDWIILTATEAQRIEEPVAEEQEPQEAPAEEVQDVDTSISEEEIAEWKAENFPEEADAEDSEPRNWAGHKIQPWEPKIGEAEIESRFGFHKASIEGENATAPKHADLREVYKDFANHLDNILPDSRDKNLAFTALEEASMWSHKAIAKTQPTA